MNYVLAKAIEHVRNEMIVYSSTASLFYTELFIREMDHDEKNLRIALDNNRMLLGVLPKLNLTSFDEEMVFRFLQNSRNVFPTGSLKVNLLELRNFSSELFSLDLFGLREIIVENYISDDDLEKLLSIPSFESLSLENKTDFFSNMTHSKNNVKKLDICSDGLNIHQFPNLRELKLRCTIPLVCSKQNKLVSLDLHYPGKLVEIDFNLYPCLTELNIRGTDEVLFINEGYYIYKISLTWVGDVNFKNCSFDSLASFKFEGGTDFLTDECAVKLLNIGANLTELDISGLSCDINVIKHPESLEKIKLRGKITDLNLERFTSLEVLDFSSLLQNFDYGAMKFAKPLKFLKITYQQYFSSVTDLPENCCDDLYIDAIKLATMPTIVDSYFRKSLTIKSGERKKLFIKSLSKGKRITILETTPDMVTMSENNVDYSGITISFLLGLFFGDENCTTLTLPKGVSVYNKRPHLLLNGSENFLPVGRLLSKFIYESKIGVFMWPGEIYNCIIDENFFPGTVEYSIKFIGCKITNMVNLRKFSTIHFDNCDFSKDALEQLFQLNFLSLTIDRCRTPEGKFDLGIIDPKNYFMAKGSDSFVKSIIKNFYQKVGAGMRKLEMSLKLTREFFGMGI